MRKLLALLLSLSLLLTLAACGEKPQTGEPTEAPAAAYHVAMVTAYGDIYDGGTNEQAWKALRSFGEKNSAKASYYCPETNDTAGRIASMERAIEGGSTVLVLPGYAFGGAIAEISGKYPEVKFIGLDVTKGDLLEAGVSLKGEAYDYNPDNWNLTDYVHMDNVYCVSYKHEVAGFMAGYAAVKLGYTKLGFYGYMSVDTITRYGYGFIQGADVAAKELGITAEMNYVCNNMFCSGDRVTGAMEQWYKEGTEVIFACGSGEAEVAQAAVNAGGKIMACNPYMSGVAKEVLAGLAMPDYGATATFALNELIIKENQALLGKIDCFGLTYEYSHVSLMCPELSAGDYADLIGGLTEGKWAVSDDTSGEPATTNVQVNWLGNIQ